MGGKVDCLEVYVKENLRKLWNELKKIQPGQGEEFNEVYWHIKARLRSLHRISPKEIDDLATVGAHLAICGDNISRIAERAGLSRPTVRKKIERLRGLMK